MARFKFDATENQTGDTVTRQQRVEELVSRNGHVLVRTPHDEKPNFRVYPDGTVDLISVTTGIEVTDFGENAELAGYCPVHGVDYMETTGYNYCPACRREDDVRRREMERMTRRAPRMVDDPAPHGSYRH